MDEAGLDWLEQFARGLELLDDYDQSGYPIVSNEVLASVSLYSYIPT